MDFHLSQMSPERNFRYRRGTTVYIESKVRPFNPQFLSISLFSQDYIIMVQDLEQDRAPAGSDVMLTKLREKLREKEKALEVLSSLPPFHPY